MHDHWSYYMNMNIKNDKKTMKKHEIIKKSLHVMFKNGYNGTGVKDLTDAAGIPKGSLYNYFENKEDYLKEALYYYYYIISKDQFDFLTNKDLEPLERIKKFYLTMIKQFENEENCKQGCFIGNITQEIGGTNKTIQKITQEIHGEIVEMIRKNLIEAVEKKEILINTDSSIISEFIVSSWQGALLRTKVSCNNKILDNFYEVLINIILK